jgi:pilus assembly protein CpaE
VAAAVIASLLALVRSSETRNALSAMLMELRDVTLETEVGELRGSRGALLERMSQTDILLVDLDIDDAEDLYQLRQIVAERHGRPVIATARQITVSGVRELIRQGIDDFVPQPLEAHSLIDAIDGARRKLRQARGGRGDGKVIAVVRAKGGMGATMLAVHLALGLIEPLKREQPKRVCLLDLDLQFGDASLYLDLDPRSDLIEIVRSPARLDAALLRSAMIRHKSGLEVLPAPVEPIPLDALRIETAARIVDLAQQDFDYVVIDLPLALAAWHETVLGMTDKVYLVTQLNVPAIRQTRRLIDIFRDEGLYSLPLSIVLNRHVWRLTDRARLRQCVKALDQGIDYYLPNDYRRVLEAIDRGVPLFEIRSRARLCRMIRAIAQDCRRELVAREASPARPVRAA